jgi:hypothetical protein
MKGLGWEWLDLGGRCVVWFLFAGFVCIVCVQVWGGILAGEWRGAGVLSGFCLLGLSALFVCKCRSGYWRVGGMRGHGRMRVLRQWYFFAWDTFFLLFLVFLFFFFISYLVGGHLFFIFVVFLALLLFLIIVFFTIGLCLFF